MIEIPLIVHELLRAATGYSITVATLDGQPALLRLATPQEVLDTARRARAGVELMTGGPIDGPELTLARARQLCTPLRWPL